MGLLLACRNEEDPIKTEGARVVTTLFINFSDTQGQKTPKSVMESFLNSNPSKLLWLVLLSARMKKNHPKISDGILPKFKIIQALIVVLIVCKNEEDPFKIESTRVVTIFLPL